MKLVNIHKQTFLFLLLFIGLPSVQAQVWTLKQCMDTAQTYNKNLQISRNNGKISEQKHKEAQANLIPKLNVNAEYKYFTNLPYQLMPLSVFGGPDGIFKEAQFGVPHNLNANIQLSMPLYNPQVYGAIQTSKKAMELYTLQYKKTEEQIYFEIANLYYNAQILHHQLVFIDSNLINVNRLVKTTQLLKEQAMAKGTDVSKIQLQSEQLASQKLIIESKYSQVINALKYAIGISAEQSLVIDPVIEYTGNNEYSGQAPIDIQLVKIQNSIIASELNTLKNSRLPSLSLIGTYGTTGFGYDKKPNNFLKFYPISFTGVQLSYPIFNGTVTERKINQKNLEIDNTELQLALATEQNSMQIRNITLQRQAIRNSVETALSQIKLAKFIYEQTILQQNQGTANLTEVLMADNALREAQQTYLSAVIDYLKTDLELKKITGNLSIKN